MLLRFFSDKDSNVLELQRFHDEIFIMEKLTAHPNIVSLLFGGNYVCKQSQNIYFYSPILLLVLSPGLQLQASLFGDLNALLVVC